MFVFLYPSALQQNTDLFTFSSFNLILSSLFDRKKNKKKFKSRFILNFNRTELNEPRVDKFNCLILTLSRLGYFCLI